MVPKPERRRKRAKGRRALIKQADKAWGKVIRSVGACQKCGKRETLQAAHIISRKHFALRWDLLNGLCLCYGCHFHFAHKEPLLFTEWIKEYYPNRYKYLMIHKGDVATDLNYQSIIDELTKALI